jgi:hypothetical protein
LFQFSVKFPRSRFSESSSSSESRKVSDSRQSSTEEVAQELFHNIEQVRILISLLDLLFNGVFLSVFLGFVLKYSHTVQ